MSKVSLSDVSNLLGSPTSAANTINANNALVETAFDNTLSRDGSIPNEMNADIDMNHNDIYNVDNLFASTLILAGKTVIPTDVTVLQTIFVPTRTVLATIDTTETTSVILTEGKRSGLFNWTVGNFSPQVTADSAQGIYVTSNTIPSTSGAWVRQYDGPWEAGWFGLTDGVADATSVSLFNSMMTLAVLQDTAIMFSASVYQFNAKLVYSTPFSLILYTPAIDGCEFRWTNSSGGLDITYTNTQSPPAIIGIDFTTTVAAGGQALNVTGVDSASLTKRGPLIDHVGCRGVNTASNYWTDGIHVVNAWYVEIKSPDIKGMDDATSPFDMVSGIHLENCQAGHLRDIYIWHVERAIKASGSIHGEGLNFEGGEIVGVSYGLDWNLPSVKPCITIHDLHINAYVRCIRLVNTYQISIHDCLLYQTHVSTVDWQGIELTGCSQINIHDNRISTAGLIDTTHTSTPITLVNSFDCQIHDNMVLDWLVPNSTFVIVANPSTANNYIHDNYIANDGSRANFQSFMGLVGSPGINVISDNPKYLFEQMANGDTTPDVSNMDNDILQYTGSAVSVTTFDNPYQGQEFTLFSNTGSAVLTLVNNGTGTGLILKGGVNYTVSAGGFIRFKYFGGLWREIWRT